MASSSSQIPSSSVMYPVDPLSSQTPSSFAKTSTPLPWDVFLSFRGLDTRSSFISHLYAALTRTAIRTFKDDAELRLGEVISDTLINVIKESKTYIVVFSENYASSSWCLDELVEICDCCRTMEKLVIGVYYHIDPSVVRRQTGSFKKAFRKHNYRYGGETQKVNKWRQALKEAAGFSGKIVSAERDESNIVEEIVEILLQINPKTLDITKYPVGLSSRVDEIDAILSRSTEGVIKFGIYGIGGMGKTTLAKALYNQLLGRRFKGTCFLTEVRETSGRTNGLVYLQKQLLDAVLKSKDKAEIHNVAEGTTLINRTCSAKVLVVIDDIDEVKQYESLVGPFASGSIVIITTRNEGILDKINVLEGYRYRVNGLSNADSLELFTKHAFGDVKPADNTFIKWSEDIVRHAGGLPLALEIFGSILLAEDENRWISFISDLKKYPNDGVVKKLVVSYDALISVNRGLPDIFLDIACFFNGWKKEVVIKIMETYYEHVNSWIDVLKKRCLLTINDDDELEMHALLQDMGRGIVRDISPDEPENHSRLWASEDIYEVLNKNKGTKAIQGIIPRVFYHKDALDGASFPTKTFRRMIKLRFLYLKNVNLRGSFKKAFENLRWLHWDCCPLVKLPFDFYPEDLAILELPHSRLITIWDLNMDKQVFKKLKTLDLSHSLDLIRTPNFTKLPYLEYLNFEGCKCLDEVHMSIGCLVGLVSLNLGGCVKVRSLPASVCNLRALNSLNICGCSALIASLTEVNMWGLTVFKSPNSIGHLSKLVELNLRDNHSAYKSPSSPDSYVIPDWDVFLCFRGIDTKETFTNNLYEVLDRNGLRTYIDNPEVRNTEEISHVLPRAVQKSRTYVVVFSEDFASSDRCMDELIEILNNKNTFKRLVIPVFYNIDPSHVLCQIGMLKEPFERHKIRFGTEKVNEWRRTLKEVAISGYHTDARSEADIVNEIVNVILFKINPKTLHVAKYPVGLDSRVKDITTLLSSGTERITRIGLHGMGGVGKTTLAKAVYNENVHRFQGSCFLENVREVLGTNDGLLSLQQKLINDVLKSKSIVIDNVDQGIEVIRARICSKKVLIVIDDWDNSKPLEFLEGPFGLGSIIIITTTNEDVLDSIKLEARYKVKELDDVESHQLFTQHAFGCNKTSYTYMELSEKVLEHAGGLPLALEVFGSNLLNQPREGWRWFIDKLKRVLVADVEKKLLMSFDALKLVNPMLQNIFLDIACFFIRHKQNEVVKILETCYTHVNHNIDILRKRCLLTINDEEELGMHDLLRDMGRGIVRNNSPDEPGKHSRLWLSEDILDVLKKHKGTETIEGIIPDDASIELSLTTETFQKMSKLRYLRLYRANVTGSFKEIFENLRWLYWDGCPLRCLPSEFHPQKLEILELPNSKMRTMWKPNVVLRVFEKLKTLNMSKSQDLTTTRDFKILPCLETLNLKGCKSLEEVHMSIGSLLRLDSLYLQGCEKLRSLPDSICSLRALTVLNISQCKSLEALPVQLGNIESITKLNANSLTVSKLPDSIGHLTKLVELDLSNNKNLKTLPDTICDLRSLEILNIDGCSGLETLPTAIGNIESLQRINGRELNVSKLPDSIGSLGKLVELDLRQNKNLESIPDTIFNLRSLEILNISWCEKLEILPDALWKLTRLRNLDASWATRLEELPDVGSSQIALSLQNLDLSKSGITALPSGFSQLLNLQSLDLSWCGSLLSILELPPNIEHINVYRCRSMERLPNLSNLRQLMTLNLELCDDLKEIQGLEDLTALRDLNLRRCSKLEGILRLEELTALTRLHLTDCCGFSEIQGLEKLASIRRLRLGGLFWESCEAYNKHLTKRLFQIYSELGREITIYIQTFLDWNDRPICPDWITESPYWTSQSSKSKSTTAHFMPNESHNFMAMILCCSGDYRYTDDVYDEDYPSSSFQCSVKNITSGFKWSAVPDGLASIMESVMVIVPKSIFLVTDDYHGIEFTADDVITSGIHLLYKTETKTNDNVMRKHETSSDALQ